MEKILILKVAISTVTSTGFLAATIVVNLDGIYRCYNELGTVLTQSKVMDLTYQIKLEELYYEFQTYQHEVDFIDLIDDPSNAVAYDHVLDVLQTEVTNREIEYATVVDRQGVIIVSANDDRTGEVFDPEGLVTYVLNASVPVVATIAMENSEYLEEGAPFHK